MHTEKQAKTGYLGPRVKRSLGLLGEGDFNCEWGLYPTYWDFSGGCSGVSFFG